MAATVDVEGFETDGDGTTYSINNRFVGTDPVTGFPALWAHNYDASIDPFSGEEGSGYIVGQAVNKHPTSAGPYTLVLDPVDVSGLTGAKLVVALAGSTVDFEDTDFLEISVDPENTGAFTTLAEFFGNPDQALSDGTTVLNTTFQDVEYDIPHGATDLVVKFDVFNTIGNETAGIDDVRVTFVPEPSAFALALLASLGFMSIRRIH